MKETERRKGPNIRERTTPARGDRKDRNVQERNGGRNLKAKEANVKPSLVKRGSNTVVVSNPSISTESSEVYEDMVVDYVDDVCGSEDESVHSAKALAVNENSNGNSSDMEIVDGSDTETINDSVSSQADSQTADEDKADKVTSIAKTTAKKSSCDYSHTPRSRSGMKADTMLSRPRKENLIRGAKTEKGTKLATKSSSDNLRIQKVHPKALSDSSDDAAVKPTEQKNNEAVQDDASNGAPSVYSDDAVNTEEDNEHEDNAGTDQRIEEMETKIKILESELREVAALEIALYSVVPEHSSSAHKVHTPARRLSRFYVHACKYWSPDRRATSARNIVSGLALVAKSCGNDVSRLTFWLSNSIVLREIISQAFGSSCHSSALAKVEPKAGVKKNETKSSPNKSKCGNEGRQLSIQGFLQFVDDWQETRAFTAALEKVESWIFLRIVESIWWQTLTPNMQSPAGATITRKSSGKLLGPALGNQQQGSFSINLWNDAIHDSLRRLCPVRTVGNECGCLPVLAKKVMGQCIGRLDVAMFNAILRESAHEIPTDPVSDPIVDTKVLPIPAGDLSFGSGAQLKNSVGQWSRWLSDFLGIDVDTKQKNVKKTPDYSEGDCEETECFPLLNALSDLLMLPKDMLMDRTVRLEVCPSISLPLVKRVLCNFTPDEFWPDPVPGAVLEALNAECIIERTLSGEPATSFPYPAAPVVYQPPTLPNVAEKVAEARNGSQLSRSASSVQKKGYTSDEELDEVESCLTSTIYKSASLSLNETVDGVNTRYDLLREVWHET